MTLDSNTWNMLFQCWWIDGIFSCSLSWELKGVDLHNVRKRIVLLSLMFEDQRENNFKKSPFSFFATSSKRLFSLSWKNPHETNRWLLQTMPCTRIENTFGDFSGIKQRSVEWATLTFSSSEVFLRWYLTKHLKQGSRKQSTFREAREEKH